MQKHKPVQATVLPLASEPPRARFQVWDTKCHQHAEHSGNSVWLETAASPNNSPLLPGGEEGGPDEPCSPQPRWALWGLCPTGTEKGTAAVTGIPAVPSPCISVTRDAPASCLRWQMRWLAVCHGSPGGFAR